MTTLILHHFEDYWEEGLEHYGTNFNELSNQLIDYLEHSPNKIDNIIVTRFEEFKLGVEHTQLVNFCEDHNIDLSVHNYGYAWIKEPEDTDDLENVTWCYSTRSDSDFENDIILLEQWQYDLKGEHVLIAGAFDRECINDLQDALQALNIGFENLDELIVGNGIDYQWRSLSPEALQNRIDCLIEEIETMTEEYYTTYNIDTFDKLAQYEPEFVKNSEAQLHKMIDDNRRLINRFNVDFYSQFEEIMEICERSMDDSFDNHYSEKADTVLKNRLIETVAIIETDNNIQKLPEWLIESHKTPKINVLEHENDEQNRKLMQDIKDKNYFIGTDSSINQNRRKRRP